MPLAFRPWVRASMNAATGFAASGFATLASFRADPAMFMHVGVRPAFLAAYTASHGASFEGNANDTFVRPSSAACDLTRSLAHVGAIQIEPNALRKIVHLIFAKTGVRTRNAGLCAIEAGLNALDQDVIGRAFDVRVGADHLVNVHGVLVRLQFTR